MMQRVEMSNKDEGMEKQKREKNRETGKKREKERKKREKSEKKRGKREEKIIRSWQRVKQKQFPEKYSHFTMKTEREKKEK